MSAPLLLRKRGQRPSQVCADCRRRKLRCDRSMPCGQCVKSGRTDYCRYTVDDARPGKRGLVKTRVSESRTLGGPTAAGIVASQNSLQKERFLSEDGPSPSLSSEPNSNIPSEDGSEQDLVWTYLWYGSYAVDRFTEPFEGKTLSLPSEVLQGENESTAYYGRSHGAILLADFPEVVNIFHPGSDGTKSVERFLRTMADTIHHNPCSEKHQVDLSRMKSLIPERQLTDTLVHLYFSRFESSYRILHIPLFFKAYDDMWGDQDTANPVVLATVLAICATCTGSNIEKLPAGIDLEHSARDWISAVQSWMSTQSGEAQRSIKFLQLGCLLFIAREMNDLHEISPAISIGTLVRAAMVSGLQREPASFLRVSRFHAELRRRLWYTIIELDLQTSLTLGIPASVSSDDFDCRLPANIDDGQLDEDIDATPLSKPPTTFTQATFHNLLARSWSLRAKVSRVVNKPHLDLPYEEVLRLDLELSAFMEEVLKIAPPELPNQAVVSFHRRFFDVLIRRFLVALHRPFGRRAGHDPRFLYSRQVCLESSVAILSHYIGTADGLDPDESAYLKCLGGADFNAELSKSSLTICHEILRTISENRRLITSHTQKSFSWMLSQQDALIAMVGKAMNTLLDGASIYRNNYRVSGELRMVLALIEARRTGEDPAIRVRESLYVGLRKAYSALRSQWSSQNQLSGSSGAPPFGPTDTDGIVPRSEDVGGGMLFDLTRNCPQFFDMAINFGDLDNIFPWPDSVENTVSASH